MEKTLPPKGKELDQHSIECLFKSEAFLREGVSDQDNVWLADYIENPDPDMHSHLNELVAVGSQFVTRHDTLEVSIAVTNARIQFFHALGVDNPSHPLHFTYSGFADTLPTLISPQTFIVFQRAMRELGLDAQAILKSDFNAACLRPLRLAEHYFTAEKNGFNGAEVL